MSSQITFAQSLFTLTNSQPTQTRLNTNRIQSKLNQKSNGFSAQMQSNKPSRDSVSLSFSFQDNSIGQPRISASSKYYQTPVMSMKRFSQPFQKIPASASTSLRTSLAQNMQRGTVVMMSSKVADAQSTLQSQLDIALNTAKAAQVGTKEAAFAWSEVEELQAAMHHAKTKDNANQLTDLEKNRIENQVSEQVSEFLKIHPEIQAQNESKKSPIVTGELPEKFMRYYSFERDSEDVFDVSNEPQIIQAREALMAAINEANSADESKAAVLWDNVEEIEANISHLKKHLESKVPKEILNLRELVDKQYQFAVEQVPGSQEAKLAWDELEELNASLSHMTESRKPRIKTNMAAIKEEIDMYRDIYPQYIDNKFYDRPMPDFDMTPAKEECEVSQVWNINLNIMKLREQLNEAMINAKNADKGSKEAAFAWDIVEEIEAGISHLKSRC